jgi:hypothetical protein
MIAELLPGANYTSAPAPIEFSPLGGGCFTVLMELITITGAGATLTMFLDYYDSASKTWVNLGSSAGITALGSYELTVCAQMAAVANSVIAKPLKQWMRVRVVNSGTVTAAVYNLVGSLAF